MSEHINNSEMRKNAIKNILKQLHEGKTVEEVQEEFNHAFDGVSASEISAAEGALIAEGLPVEEVQKLCDVHSSVFKGSIEEIHQTEDVTTIPGHPANTLVRENRLIEEIISNHIQPYLSDFENNIDALIKGITDLERISTHYKTKENLFFPLMEKHDITAPPQVMWGVDDEIRAQLKEIKEILVAYPEGKDAFSEKSEEVIEKINEMIFKEENILIPMLVETLDEEEWGIIAEGGPEVGYILDYVPEWRPSTSEIKTSSKEEFSVDGEVRLPSGVFKLNELTAMLNTLPMDITFVNKDDLVKYFSEGKERAFPRARTIIGREVSNCHPPSSVHVVEKIVEDFKSGVKDHEDFWIHMKDKLILIRYFAVRDENNEYLGVVEITQDIKPLQEITGEKRLLSE